MKTFKELRESCWTGYTAKGLKKKGNRMVPNCVPVKEDGMGVGAVAGSGAASLSTDQREPGVSKKRNPVMMGIERRKAPKL